ERFQSTQEPKGKPARYVGRGESGSEQRTAQAEPATQELRIETVPGTTGQRFSKVLIVPLGGAVRLGMKDKQDLERVENRGDFEGGDFEVIEFQDRPDPATIILVGKKAGTSRLTLIAVNGAQEDYQVIVTNESQQIQGTWKVTRVEMNDKHLPQE